MKSKLADITVHNPITGEPKNVKAYLVGGTTGVFAVWTEKFKNKTLICTATGDDGYWQQRNHYDPYWIPGIIESFQHALKDIEQSS